MSRHDGTVAASRLTHIVYHTCQVRSLHPRLWGRFERVKLGGGRKAARAAWSGLSATRAQAAKPVALPRASQSPERPFAAFGPDGNRSDRPGCGIIIPQIATCAARDRCLCRWHGRHRRHRAAACRGIMALANCFETPVIAIALLAAPMGCTRYLLARLRGCRPVRGKAQVRRHHGR